MEYQIWYKRNWPLSMPSKNKTLIVTYAKRLRAAYGDTRGELIKVRKINA